MNKKDALKRLDSLENEAQELRKIINGEEYTIDDIVSYEAACKILKEEYHYNADVSKKLKTIIKAANYIDNSNKIYTPDFNNNHEHKHAPYFKFNGSGFVLVSLSVWFASTCVPLAYYYKVKSTGEIIAKRFLSLYKQWMEEQ